MEDCGTGKNVTQLIAQISHSTLEQADGLSSLTVQWISLT